MRSIVVACLLCVLFIHPAAADDRHDAIEALKKRDYATALRLLRPYADGGGDPLSEFTVGIILEGGFGNPDKQPEQGIALIRRAAEHGLPEAQDILGQRLRDGKNVARDYAAAITWFTKAAEVGLPQAAANLGSMYYSGFGTALDYAAARKWLQIAADKGNALGEDGLASIYATGQDVPRDDALADRLYLAAAEQGDYFGELAIGEAYAGGVGVARDPVEAYVGLTLATASRDFSRMQAQNRDRLVKDRDGLLAHFSPAEKKRAFALLQERKTTLNPG